MFRTKNIMYNTVPILPGQLFMSIQSFKKLFVLVHELGSFYSLTNQVKIIWRDEPNYENFKLILLGYFCFC